MSTEENNQATKRTPNSGACSGSMSIKIARARLDDLPEYSDITVNEATDYELFDALARRGYDVKLSTPNAKTLDRRVAEWEAEKKRTRKP